MVNNFKKISANIYIILCLLFMYAPIFILIIFSFTDTNIIGTWDKFTFKLYWDLFNNAKIMDALKNTILIALVSAAVSTILGTLGAIGIFYSKKRTRKALETIAQIPVLSPEIVIALSLTIMFVFLSVEFNFITLLIGHVVLTVPFVVLSVMPKLKQMDPNVYEAALDLGAKPIYAMRKIIMPDIMPGIFSGFILSITLSLDDYIITAFTKAPSYNTISTYVQGVTSRRGALPPALRALTTLIFVLALFILVVYNLRINKATSKRRHY